MKHDNNKIDPNDPETWPEEIGGLKEDPIKFKDWQIKGKTVDF